MLIRASKTPFLERWFRSYTRRYLERSFHAVHLLGEPPQLADAEDAPLLVCLSHSSWWDVLLPFHLATDVVGWEWYGVMDARQLERYRFFARLGVIGVDRTSLAGAREFLTYAEALLRGKQRALWWTPQGEMVSNRARPIHFQPGLGHLAARLGDFYCLTVGLHYEFWNERLPEAFVTFAPVERFQCAPNALDRRAFVHAQENRMAMLLDTLIARVEQRDPAAFQPLLRGKTGISPTYDTLRATAARMRGEQFTTEHSAIVTPQWKRKKNPGQD